ncbi:MAG: pentapeptide repeat-containing protein [Nostoc sp.]|uniref:pentapeptide repeat-containing protein n=1 Tax=Nostoc sp. TaxID=1180 RepID=UPI002FF79C5F
MSDNKTDTLKDWLIILAVIFIFFLIAVLLIFLFSDFAFLNPKGLETEQRLDYGTKALTTLGAIFGGFAVLINAFYAAKRWEAMDKSALAANESAKAALKNAEAALKNAYIAQDKQITERFAKAIEQLGNEKIETRLGAIYTLERIAKDSKDDHWTIMEVLTAFVRENAPLKDFSENNTGNTDSLIIVHTRNYQKPKEIEQKPKLQTDIQAALIVIGRRNPKNDAKNQWLDLHNIDIRGADLTKVEMQGANLMEANLQWVVFEEAKLQGAFFSGANLRRAELWEANLQKAVFKGANLQKAYLIEANLQEANLEGANLEGADFDGANLKEAFLIGANLSEAENLGQEQIEKAIGDRTTILPENLQPPEHWKAQVSPSELER